MGENGNTPQETRIVKAIERSRIAVCFVAMFLGHSDYFRTFAALTVVSLAGLTAVESLLFGDASARIKNWPVGTPYQACAVGLQQRRARPRHARPSRDARDRAHRRGPRDDDGLHPSLHPALGRQPPVPRQGRLDPQEALLRRREPHVSGGVVIYKWGAF